MSGHGNTQDGEARQEDAKREVGGCIIDDAPIGLTFVEIFAVSIDCKKNPADLYGTITIDDGLSSEVVFRRDRSNTQRVGPGGLAELTGPARAVWCYGEVVMSVDLMTPDDEEVGSGKVVWNTYDAAEMEYDKVEEYELEGESGAMTVRCAVVTNAVVATVVVELTGDGKKDLYGTISAATAMFGPADKVTLFSKQREDAVSVPAGEGVPLLRNVAVVPLDSSLEIRADLWYMSPGAGGHLVKAEAVFDASTTGTERKVIRGPDGEVTVQVAWSPN